MSAFYIASLKHTGHQDEFITFWQWNHCGYTPVVGQYIGRYCFGEAVSLNDGEDCLAVPVEAVERILSPEPYGFISGKACRWYDQRGPVVENAAENWSAMEAASFHDGRRVRLIKPEVFRGRRRALHAPEGAAA